MGNGLRLTAGTELLILDVESLAVAARVELQPEGFEHWFGPEVEFLDDDRLLVVTEHVSEWSLNEIDGELVVKEQQELAPANMHMYWATGNYHSDRIAWLDPDRNLNIGSTKDPDRALSIKMRPMPAIPYVRLSPDGKIVSVNDGSTRLFDASSGKLLHDFGRRSAGDPRTDSRFSLNSKYMICNTKNEHVLFDLINYQIKSRFPCNGYMCGSDWSRDGKLVAMVEDFETIVVRDANDFEELFRLRTPVALGIQAIRFSPDRRYLCARVSKNQIHRFDLDAMKVELRRLSLDW